jgi:hypothetical protein
MTIDLKAPEVQTAIAEAVDAALAPLKAKNVELIGELRQARKGKDIDPEVVTRLEEQVEALKGERDESRKAAKTAQTEAEKAKKLHEAETGFTQRLLIDNGLSAALIASGVKEPALIKAAKAMLQPQAQIVADGDNRVAKVGDKTLDAFVTDWAKSEEGKFFVSAQQNSGGGANGGGANGGAPTVKPNMDGTPAERVAALKQRYPGLESSN